MSKASQRKLAAKQKRRGQEGGILKSEAREVLEHVGDRIHADDPPVYWQLRSKVSAADKHHPETGSLMSAFIRLGPTLDALANVADDRDKPPGEPVLPGLLIEHTSDEPLHRVEPMDLTLVDTALSSAEGPHGLLDAELKQRSPRVSSLAWVCCLHSPSYPMAVWMVSRGGARLTSLRSYGNWITFPQSSILNDVAEITRLELRTESKLGQTLATNANSHQNSTAARPYVSVLMACLEQMADMLDQEVNRDEFFNEVHESDLDRAERRLEEARAAAAADVKMLRQRLDEAETRNQQLSQRLAAQAASGATLDSTPAPRARLTDRLRCFA